MTVATVVISALLLAGGSPAGDLVAEPRRASEIDASRGRIFDLLWRRPLVRTGIFRTVGTSFGGPAILPGRNLLVVGTGEGVVEGLSIRDGHVRWTYVHGAPFESSAVIVRVATGDELCVIGSRDGTLLALAASTGKLRWKVTLDGDARPPAQVIGNRLLVTTASNKIYLLEAASGQTVWAKGRSAPTGLTILGQARALEHGGNVYATFSDGYAEAYRFADGSLVWSRPLSVEGGEFVDADADPLLVGGKLFVASYSDGILALEPATGQTLWRRPAPSVTRLATYGELIIAASADGYLWGLGKKDGALVYRTRVPAGPVSRLIVRDDVVVLTVGVSGLVVLEAQTGRPMQATPYGETQVGDPVWEGEELAFVGGSGYLYALRKIARTALTER